MFCDDPSAIRARMVITSSYPPPIQTHSHIQTRVRLC